MAQPVGFPSTNMAAILCVVHDRGQWPLGRCPDSFLMGVPCLCFGYRMGRVLEWMSMHGLALYKPGLVTITSSVSWGEGYIQSFNLWRATYTMCFPFRTKFQIRNQTKGFTNLDSHTHSKWNSQEVQVMTFVRATWLCILMRGEILCMYVESLCKNKERFEEFWGDVEGCYFLCFDPGG